MREEVLKQVKKLLPCVFKTFGTHVYLAECCGSRAQKLRAVPKGMDIALGNTPVNYEYKEYAYPEFTNIKNGHFKLEDYLYINYRYHSVIKDNPVNRTNNKEGNFGTEEHASAIHTIVSRQEQVVGVYISGIYSYFLSSNGLYRIIMGDPIGLMLTKEEEEELWLLFDKEMEGKYVLAIPSYVKNQSAVYVEIRDKFFKRYKNKIVHESPMFYNTNHQRGVDDLQLVIMKH